jgi:regulatory protein
MAQPPDHDPADTGAAYDKALRILNAAGQTRSGLERRLARADLDPDTIADVVGRLQSAGYVDDTAFARSRLRRRQEQGRGARLIAAELRQKGISPEVIDEVLADRDEDVEVARAGELAVKLVARKAGESPAKRRDHVMAALVRRGYPAGVARRALELANLGVESGT